MFYLGVFAGAVIVYGVTEFFKKFKIVEKNPEHETNQTQTKEGNE